MFSLKQAAEYVSNLIPTPETDLRPKQLPDDVPTFTPLANNVIILPASVNNKTVDNIDTICQAIEIATDEGQREHEEYLRTVEIEEELSSDAYDALDRAYDAARTLREEIENPVWTPKGNAFQWAKQAIITRNPWEAFEFAFEDMQKSASCAQGLNVLFSDAERIRKAAPPLVASSILSNMLSMANAVLNAAQNDMRHEENKSGKRPADVYRRWADTLRWIVRHELTSRASRILRELILEQSLPEAELEAPDWVDAYTGEVDMSMADRITIRVPQQDKDEIEMAAAQASEGFNSDDDLEKSLYHHDISTEAMEWDVREPTWMEIQNDLRPSEDQEILRENEAIKRFRKEITKTYNKYIKKGMSKEAATELVKHNIHAPIRIEDPNTGEETLGQNSEVDLAIRELNKLAETYETKDIAYIFLGMQNEFGFDEEDAAKIHVAGSPNNLMDWIDLFGDEVMESLYSTFEPYVYKNDLDTEEKPKVAEVEQPQEAIDTPWEDSETATVSYFAEQTIRDIVKSAKKDIEGQVSPNVFRTPEFIEGFLRAMSAGASQTYKDTDNVWRSAGNKAGWEAWMEHFNPTAFKAYQQARRDGLNFNKAKSVFWMVTRGTKRDTVVSPAPKRRKSALRPEVGKWAQDHMVDP